MLVVPTDIWHPLQLACKKVFPTITPRKMAHFCWAKWCHSKSPPPSTSIRVWYAYRPFLVPYRNLLLPAFRCYCKLCHCPLVLMSTCCPVLL